MQKAMSRRLALRRPKGADLARIEEEIALIEARTPPLPDDATRLEALREGRSTVIRRRNLIADIHPVHLRSRRFQPGTKPVAHAPRVRRTDVPGRHGQSAVG